MAVVAITPQFRRRRSALMMCGAAQSMPGRFMAWAALRYQAKAAQCAYSGQSGRRPPLYRRESIACPCSASRVHYRESPICHSHASGYFRRSRAFHGEGYQIVIKRSECSADLLRGNGAILQRLQQQTGQPYPLQLLLPQSSSQTLARSGAVPRPAFFGRIELTTSIGETHTSHRSHQHHR